jgi:sulfur relay (sulfurtransferase) complex TusBCD TusD component (DsrE family)
MRIECCVIEDALKGYHELSGGHLPKRIFFFRDGVSEGELEQVRAQEIPGIDSVLAHLLLESMF